MQQHPVPQHIASYEFRLVGDMTLKQFGFLAVPGLVAILIYASGIPVYFKWPLISFLVLLGIGLAFVPLEERPLHRWIIAFFKAVYLPTQFIWKKEPQRLEIFETTSAQQAAAKVPPIPRPNQDQLSQYLQTLPHQKTALEEVEENSLAKIGQLFKNINVSFAPTPTTPSAQIQTTPTPLPVDEPLPPKEKPQIVKPAPKVGPPPPEHAGPSFQSLRPVQIKVDPEKERPTVEAKMSPGLPFPQTPRSPNLLVGMVLDSSGKMIENAILEIRDEQKLPVRALKTNKLGQFRIVTPLKNGVYEIETEKEGFDFDIIKVELKGEPVPPIEIRAKKVS